VAHPGSWALGTGVISRGVKRPWLEVNRSYLVPQLRMSGAMPLLLYAFVGWAGKPLPFAVMFEGTLRFV